MVSDRDRATGAGSGLPRTRDRRRAVRGQATQLVLRFDAAGHSGRAKLGAILADQIRLAVAHRAAQGVMGEIVRLACQGEVSRYLPQKRTYYAHLEFLRS